MGPIRRERASFEEACRRAVRPEVGGIDHQALWRPRTTGEHGEDAVEHAETSPSHEAVVEGLVRPILGRRVAPAQPAAVDMEDAANHPFVVDRGHAVREREVGRNPPALRPAQPEQISHGSTSGDHGVSHPDRALAPINGFLGSRPIIAVQSSRSSQKQVTILLKQPNHLLDNNLDRGVLPVATAYQQGHLHAGWHRTEIAGS